MATQLRCKVTRTFDGRAMLNLGCGRRNHPEWTNVDLHVKGPGVIRADLRRGIPFDEGAFHVVYHSHLLEHLDREQAAFLLKECHRVLKPAGVIRVVVPDLEGIARAYLACLEGAVRGDDGMAQRYEWMVLELLDQMLRRRSGGAMTAYLAAASRADGLDFVVQRMGRAFVEEHRPLSVRAGGQKLDSNGRKPSVAAAVDGHAARGVIGTLRQLCARWAFRASGELHRWMYDRYSIQRALSAAGFEQAQVHSASESRIPAWHTCGLDVEEDGSVYKPDSLYAEGTKGSGRRLEPS